MACLNSSELFALFDEKKLIQLTQFYPQDFFPIELMVINDQLETYIIGVRSNGQFFDLKGIDDLAQKMVKTKQKKKDRVSTCLFACYIDLDSTCYNCNCGNNIFGMNSYGSVNLNTEINTQYFRSSNSNSSLIIK